MEDPTQVWKFKIFSRKPPPQPEVPPPMCQKAPSCKNCRYSRSRTCGSNEEQYKCTRIPEIEEPSLASLKESVTANCYSCCCNLKEFFKEMLKAVSGDPSNRVCDILCEMTDLLLALAEDCVYFLRRICKCLYENLTEKC